jgi:hypothetical protein
MVGFVRRWDAHFENACVAVVVGLKNRKAVTQCRAGL